MLVDWRKLLDKIINTISFELTRRCNLHCRWCSKGEPQNMDITKDIIDKTLDEISPYGIYVIRVTGGEPSLTPELLEYLIDGIISKKIKVNNIYFITNGTITSDIIKRSIYKMLDYAKTIKKERQEIADYFSDRTTDLFDSLKDRDFAWCTMLSVWEHDNRATYQTVKEFYTIDNELYSIIDQDEMGADSGRIVIEGRAEQYNQFKPEELHYIRVIDNHYNLICDDDEAVVGKISIYKCLSISSNGNVFVGGMKSFEHTDEDYLFNIMDCHNDFWDRVDTWCWDHPIFRKAHEKIEEYKALVWKKEHINYLKDDPLVQYESSLKKFIDLIYALEKMQKEYHKKLPHLNHYELNIFCACASGVVMLESGMNIDGVKMYLSDVTGFEEDFLNEIFGDKPEENLTKIINGYIKMNNDRAVNKVQNPIMKFFARLYADM